MTHAPSDAAGSAAQAADGQDASFWRAHTQISLSPVAAPSILGLFGFAAATFMVAANLAQWYGTTTAGVIITPLVLFPFAMFFGGLGQFLAGMWSYRARDGLATAMHGMWGAFWLAYGLYFLLAVLVGRIPFVTGTGPLAHSAQVAFGYWFVVLAAITWMGAFAALSKNIALTAVLTTLAAGATMLAIAWVGSFPSVVQPAGDVLVASAVFAFYTASALMLEGSFQRVILPVGNLMSRGKAAAPVRPIQYDLGEPGVKAGQ